MHGITSPFGSMVIYPLGIPAAHPLSKYGIRASTLAGKCLAVFSFP